jgi:hypothetical protein
LWGKRKGSRRTALKWARLKRLTNDANGAHPNCAKGRVPTSFGSRAFAPFVRRAPSVALYRRVRPYQPRRY